MSSQPASTHLGPPFFANSDYRQLVKEVFISPVRSVLVIDDEYPTLDAGLRSVATNDGKWPVDPAAATRVLEILKFCRERSQPWLIDVHDGTSYGQPPIPHLHQSDLIILDYHLTGNEGAELAIGLLRSLASSENFNLVIVYTKGEGNQIQSVFWGIVKSLLIKTWDGAIKDEEQKAITEKIQEWEMADPDILGRLRETLSPESYTRYRVGDLEDEAVIRSRLGGLLDRSTVRAELSVDQLFDWLISDRHVDSAPQMADQEYGPLSCHFRTDTNWIKLDGLFITVVDKRRSPDELETKLVDALAAFQPSPLHLLMAKMRSVMDEKGTSAESVVLRDRYLQAGWLEELTKPTKDKKRLLTLVVDRHWEALGERLRPDVDGYAARLTALVDSTDPKRFLSFYVGETMIQQADQMSAAVNRYNCSQPIDRFHLTTGHILELTEEDPTTFWVCLSPACDLVPGQRGLKRDGSPADNWQGRLGTFMPFIAAKLSRVEAARAIPKATDSAYLFLSIAGKDMCFEAFPNADTKSPPAWEQMFAGDQGRFTGAPPTTEVRRVLSADGEIRAITRKATIRAQLRYEYALNLLQRLGASLSRVGVDFQAKR